MNEEKESGSGMLMLNGKNVVTPKTLVPRLVSGVKDVGLDCEVRSEIELGAEVADDDST